MKTLNEIRNELATKSGFSDYGELYYKSSLYIINSLNEQASELMEKQCITYQTELDTLKANINNGIGMRVVLHEKIKSLEKANEILRNRNKFFVEENEKLAKEKGFRILIDSQHGKQANEKNIRSYISELIQYYEWIYKQDNHYMIKSCINSLIHIRDNI